MKKYFIASTIFHVVLLFFFMAAQWLQIHRMVKVTKVNVVEKSVRVDVVELPKLTLKELKWKKLNNSKAPAVSRVKESRVPDTSDNKLEYKEVDKKKKLDDLLSNFSRKKIPKNKKKLNKKKDNKENQDVEKLLIAGNKLSLGKDLEGKNRDKEGSLIQNYGERLVEQIKPYWRLPQRFLVSNFSCQVKLFISPKGKVTQIEIYKGSGDHEYDKLVVEAIKKASPFPTPNAKIAPELMQGALVLGFPL